MSILLRTSHRPISESRSGGLPDPSQLCAHRLSDEGGYGGRWGQKRETKRDEAPEASCYATADLLTYISKQKQLAAGYWSASPTQHKAPGQKHTGCGIHAYWTQRVESVCGSPRLFIQDIAADTKRLIIITARQISWIRTQKPFVEQPAGGFERSSSSTPPQEAGKLGQTE